MKLVFICLHIMQTHISSRPLLLFKKLLGMFWLHESILWFSYNLLRHVGIIRSCKKVESIHRTHEIFLFIAIYIVDDSCFTLPLRYTWISFLPHLIYQNQLEPWKRSSYFNIQTMKTLLINLSCFA